MSGPVPIAVDGLALAVVLTVLLWRANWLWSGAALVAAACGAAFAFVLAWLLSDQLRVLEVSLTVASRAWIAGAFAAVGVLAVGIIRGGARRRVVAAAGVVLAVTAGALGVNADFGQYSTVGSLGGAAVARPLVLPRAIPHPSPPSPTPVPTAPVPGRADVLYGSAVPAGQPSVGRLGSVVIPGTLSGFRPRPAYVYLPPRALTATPPRLPVLILLSGQPGGPDSVVQAGQVEKILNAYAAAHAGLAPIVVIPDQLSAPQLNPMCLDSPIGNSASYLTRDVPRWILANLRVQPQVGAWGIGGFSQGGTCTIQLGAGHPELFSALLDIAGQDAPFSGSVANTVQTGFGGSVAAYRAALPKTLLRAGAPFRDTVGIFTSGRLDARYGAIADGMSRAAAASGMTVTRLVSAGTGHDWATVRWSIEQALPILGAHFRLER